MNLDIRLDRNIDLHELGQGLAAFFKKNIQLDGHAEKVMLHDPELNGPASDCSTLQVASFLSYWGVSGTNDKELARLGGRLFRDLSFAKPFKGKYNVLVGECGTFDLAEAGAAFSGLYLLDYELVKERESEILFFVESHILSAFSKQGNGAFYKNKNALEFDVLNGNIYAALVIAETQKVLGIDKYTWYIESTVKHLIARFNVNERLGWPYSETWDGAVKLGYSLAYQATIIGWGFLLSPYLSKEVRKKWLNVLWAAQQRVAIGYDSGKIEANESPSWSRSWDNSWEIDLAYGRWESDFCVDHVLNRLSHLASKFHSDGISVFSDQRTNNLKRTPIGTTMRKASNFSSIFCSILTGGEATGTLDPRFTIQAI